MVELQAVSEALDERNTAYQRIALGLGWRTWDVNAKNEEGDLIKVTAKEERKVLSKEKAAETRRVNKETLMNLEINLSGKYFIEYYTWKKGKSIQEKIEWLKSKNK